MFAAFLLVLQVIGGKGCRRGAQKWFEVFYSYINWHFNCLIRKTKYFILRVFIYSICGTLHSVDQYLNIKLTDISVNDTEKYPHMLYVLNAILNQLIQFPCNTFGFILFQIGEKLLYPRFCGALCSVAGWRSWYTIVARCSTQRSCHQHTLKTYIQINASPTTG